jgi:hypothetical protein
VVQAAVALVCLDKEVTEQGDLVEAVAAVVLEELLGKPNNLVLQVTEAIMAEVAVALHMDLTLAITPLTVPFA